MTFSPYVPWHGVVTRGISHKLSGKSRTLPQTSRMFLKAMITNRTTRRGKSQNDGRRRPSHREGFGPQDDMNQHVIPKTLYTTSPGRSAASASSVCGHKIQACVLCAPRLTLVMFPHPYPNTSKKRFQKYISPLTNSRSLDLAVYLQSWASDDYSDKLE